LGISRVAVNMPIAARLFAEPQATHFRGVVVGKPHSPHAQQPQRLFSGEGGADGRGERGAAKDVSQAAALMDQCTEMLKKAMQDL